MDFDLLTRAANTLRYTGHNDLALVCEAAKQRIEQLERTVLAAAVTIEQLGKDLERMDKASSANPRPPSIVSLATPPWFLQLGLDAGSQPVADPLSGAAIPS